MKIIMKSYRKGVKMLNWSNNGQSHAMTQKDKIPTRKRQQVNMCKIIPANKNNMHDKILTG